MIFAAILAGGIGSRMGGTDTPKQFLDLGDKPVIIHTIEKFVINSKIDKIIVLTPQSFINHTNHLINEYIGENEDVVVIEGGETRNDTLNNSLSYINSIKTEENPIVVKHAAARIFVSTDMIEKCLELTKEHGAAGPILRSSDFMIEAKDNKVLNIPPRAHMVHVQTPQGFRLQEYLETYNDLTPEEIPTIHDLISLYYLRGKEVFLFDGDKSNFKITTPVDVAIAREFLL